ncbi:MAG TPA: hypothetical protein VH481_09140 [Nitrososphaeraceae archaeon]|jgi:hypothetical protein
MTIERTLLKEIEESQRWFDTQKDESTYKRDLAKRIELLNWVLENMKNPNIQICPLIETRMNQILDEINKKDSIIEADPLDSEVRILDWILYIVCSNEDY